MNAIVEGMRPTIAVTTPPLLRLLFQRCWAMQPETRPAMRDVIHELKWIIEFAERAPDKWELVTGDVLPEEFFSTPPVAFSDDFSSMY